MPSYHYEQGDRPLDGYTIQYAIGRGGFGEVYFAVSDAGREVALKAVQNFEDVELRGIGHCMNLKSPHLVMIFDVKRSDDGTPWVIMEYVSGPSLRELLDETPAGPGGQKTGGLGSEKALYFIRELTRGVGYLHEAGVVHRDLKPHNVFFEDGMVKVGDYSLSKAITHSHRSGHTMTVGSVHYMAPEISMGRYDKTVDIYALGVMLYEMLKGEPPFVGESVGEVLMKHLNGELDLSGIPDPFAAVIKKAMNRDPEQRYQTAKEMYEALTPDAAGAIDESIPASLSLVGARPKSVQPVASPESAALTETKTLNAPTALRDTTPSREAFDGTAIYDANYITRIFLSLATAGILITTATILESGRLISAERLLSLVTSTWGGMIFCVTPLVAIFSKKRGFAVGIVCRAAMLVLLAISYGIWDEYCRDNSVSDRHISAMFTGLAASIVLFDWRLLVRDDRENRISIGYTLLIGLIAGVVYIQVSQNIELVIFTVATAISAGLVAQLVSRDLDASEQTATNGHVETTAPNNTQQPASLSHVEEPV
ncbi:MAG: serine/threonine-protein kinase [Planctomycetota bacterium]